ncbi:B-box zinc finger protein 22-like protein [Drosera capensis]
MKIQCHVCEAAEAAVLCCADEAALCHACDEKVHAANKLAGKHQRVNLSNNSSQMPKCDICQELVGYFFCLEDRALLCRKCDVAIHSSNPFVSGHQRFLLTGVKVGLESTEPGSSSSGMKPLSADKVSEPETASLPRRTAPKSPTMQYEKAAPKQSSVVGDLTPSKRSATMSISEDFSRMLPVQGGGSMDSRLSFSAGSVAGSLSQWHMDDFLGMSDFNQNFGYADNSSSKADSGKLGESDSSSILKSSEDDLDFDERLGQVPDVAWAPRPASPPTASGLFWSNNSHPAADNAAFVPDISWTSLQNAHQHQPNPSMIKRRRQQMK